MEHNKRLKTSTGSTSSTTSITYEKKKKASVTQHTALLMLY
jgi:hypothetical protein